MKDLLVACETIKDEVLKVVEKNHFLDDIIWMDGMLHNNPDLLRSELQKAIHENTSYDHILFAYGNCGNALVGLYSEGSDLIIPATADCISMLLHDSEEIQTIRKNTYFFTKGWIEGEKSLIVEYEHCMKKYGEKRTKTIFESLLKHYKNLMFIDCEAYPSEKYISTTKDFAKKAGLEMVLQRGNLTLLEKLITKLWDHDFILISKGEQVEFQHFGNQTQSNLNIL
ncbi:MAG: DUF1638 domain-containing protein [Eubacteriales bacterium]